MLPNYPKLFGFIGQVDEMKGKTIGDISIEKMEWGSISHTCILFRFTDNTRGYLLGQNTQGLAVGPDVSVYAGRFFTPEEFGQVQSDIKRHSEQRDRETLEAKRRHLEQLKKELGQP
jgi:hypothetical protein